ncbi:MAG: ATP-binding cassette domain-containing protein [Propionibacteriaceae bacterium]|nr:ATP-binding cassette domain-containing protein [Propionibacteriaceae bacterium]
MIETQGLTKRFGQTTAVDNLTITVQPGSVTGFLGPNGAGKSTTMRIMVGLDNPTSGVATVNGRSYEGHQAPLREVGVLLDAKALHKGRSARAHLRALAATHGIPNSRVAEVIGLTGLESVADKRAGSFSLGMSQRLGIAAALLGDPATLILDEPVNGLDPEGVAWVRMLVRSLAAEGRTIFISSHLMSEMSQTADHVIVLGRGKMLADMPIGELLASASGTATRVRSPHAAEIASLLISPSVQVTSEEPGLLVVKGVDAVRIGEEAARHGWILHELTPITSSLESVYLELTESSVQYHSQSAASANQGATA